MKKSFGKIFCLLLALTLCLLAGVNAGAEEPEVLVNAGDATIGGTVTVTINIPEEITTQSLGIIFDYDKDILSNAVGSWLLTGAAMSDFSDDTAVIAYASAKEISGDVFTVTFDVADDITCRGTSVVCEISVDGTPAGIVVGDVVIHGATVIRDAKASTCTVEGYTGDTYCVKCGDMVKKGTAIAVNPNNHVHTEVRDSVEPTGYEDGYTGDTYCIDCGVMTVAGKVIPKLVLVKTEGGEGRGGDVIAVDFVVQDTAALEAIGLLDVIYDSDKFELVDGEWLLSGAALSEWNIAEEVASLAYNKAETVNGAIFRLYFRVLPGVEDGKYEIGFADARCQIDGKSQKMWIETGVITIVNLYRGDMDDDRDVDAADAILSLKCLLFSKRFEKNQNIDFNGDGVENANDPVYLLRFVLFPVHYPLMGNVK